MQNEPNKITGETVQSYTTHDPWMRRYEIKKLFGEQATSH